MSRIVLCITFAFCWGVLASLEAESNDDTIERFGRKPNSNSKKPIKEAVKHKANNKPEQKQKTSHSIPPGQLKKIENSCRGGKCKGQKEKSKKQRSDVKKNYLRARSEKSRKGAKQLEREIEEELQLILEYKQLQLKQVGLENTIDAQDDGLIDFDIAWLPQLDAALDQRRKGKGRGRRSLLFFGTYAAYKWTMPIIYFINPNIPSQFHAVIDQAVRDISSNESSIRFQKTAVKLDGTDFIEFQLFEPEDPESLVCGHSAIGKRADRNDIFLRFNESLCGNPVGTVYHEVLHCLGVNHEHGRVDRDSHLTVHMDRIDPKYADAFTRLDERIFSSHGVPYDWDSVMHYEASVAAVEPGSITLEPIGGFDPAKLGQRDHLSCGDIQHLRRMYGCKTGCTEFSTECGRWSNEYECVAADSWYWMGINCPVACGYACPARCPARCASFCAKQNEQSIQDQRAQYFPQC